MRKSLCWCYFLFSQCALSFEKRAHRLHSSKGLPQHLSGVSILSHYPLQLFQILIIVLKTLMLPQSVLILADHLGIYPLSENEGCYVRNTSTFSLWFPPDQTAPPAPTLKSFILCLCSFKKRHLLTVTLISLYFFFGFATKNYSFCFLSS